MSALLQSGGYGHRVRYEGHGVYAISWRFDTKIGRLRRVRGFTRTTDRKGAARFAKKWRLALPDGD